MLYHLIRPLLFLLPPETAHRITLRLLSSWALLFPYAPPEKQAVIRVMGINFPSRVGLAAGLDKNGDCIEGFANCGFGFIELGTVTPLPQAGNEGPRIFRLVPARALINRMGFPNKGVDYLVTRVSELKSRPIIGINIGKNATTPIAEAVTDYIICLEKVYTVADYVVINISSPNTPQLRDLQSENYLFDLLTRLKQQQEQLAMTYGKRVPLVVKVSPDLDREQLETMAHVLLGTEIDGVIVSNTTTSREGVEAFIEAQAAGGLSGAPLFEKSLEIIRVLNGILKGRIPIIATGGIMSAQDAIRKIEAGAVLVQLYTGLIYEGPGLIKAVSKAID